MIGRIVSEKGLDAAPLDEVHIHDGNALILYKSMPSASSKLYVTIPSAVAVIGSEAENGRSNFASTLKIGHLVTGSDTGETAYQYVTVFLGRSFQIMSRRLSTDLRKFASVRPNSIALRMLEYSRITMLALSSKSVSVRMASFLTVFSHPNPRTF